MWVRPKRGRHARTGAHWLGILLAIANTAAIPSDADPTLSQSRLITGHAGISSARDHAYSLRVLTGYAADPAECGDVQLGPLPPGNYTGKEAWLKLIESVCDLVTRRDESTGETQVFANMSRCECSFGFPRLKVGQQGHVVVIRPPLPTLEERVPATILLMDRKRIEETGAISVAELLRYVAPTAFHRGAGFRASGAQYAELRGLGTAYTLVLLNGRRTWGTVADVESNAFDLSAIPSSAVERVEISADTNSISDGMDAIGGIVNIVLKDRVEHTVGLRYGAARSGGSQHHASMSAGFESEHARLALFIDAERRGELLGRERDRWNDQDYTRFGGQDYRSRFGSPPNVSSIDGENLPGLAATFAAAEWNADTGAFDFIDGRQNHSSLRAFQAIVPEGSRVTTLAHGSARWGSTRVSMELMTILRESELQSFPSIIAGHLMGEQHPDNPFGRPVSVDGLLAGLPAERYHLQSGSRRVAVAVEGPLGRWSYRAFFVRADEWAIERVRNVMNDTVLSSALQANDVQGSLSLYSTMRSVATPANLLTERWLGNYSATATQAQASLQGAPMRLPTGDLSVNVGVEGRRERVNFDPFVGGAVRDISSAFGQGHVPLIHPGMNLPGMKDVKLMLGARRDHYHDIGPVVTKQVGFVWNMNDSITWRGSSSASFRPPSLAELHSRRGEFSTVVFDPRRKETAVTGLRSGGNPQLRPTSGHARSVSVSFRPSDAWHGSVEYWRIQAQGHISVLSPLALLADEERTPESVVRAPPSPEDTAADRPGRLLLLDVSLKNVGGAKTEGVDLSIDTAIDTRAGRFAPALVVSYTRKFLYSDLPHSQNRMEDRVGVASTFGTIPKQRAVASLAYERADWHAAVHARVSSSYRDHDVSGEPLNRQVPGRAIWDLHLSKAVGKRLRFTVGAFNVTDWEPPFAHVGGSLGFDPSQGDLTGREIYGKVSAVF